LKEEWIRFPKKKPKTRWFLTFKIFNPSVFDFFSEIKSTFPRKREGVVYRFDFNIGIIIIFVAFKTLLLLKEVSIPKTRWF
jgi:hypothetical protein